MSTSVASPGRLFRQLAASPTLAAAAIVTLGVSIGAATAIYSAVSAVLLRPLPFRDPDNLAVVWQTDPKKGTPAIELSSREYAGWKRRLGAFDDLAAVTAANLRVNLAGHGDPVQVEAALVTPNFFRALGVVPLRGRDFDRREETDTTGASVLVSEGLWKRQYGGDPTLVGRTIVSAGTPSTVVGILPAHMLPRGVDLWFSTAGLAHDAPDLGVLKLVGRLGRASRSNRRRPSSTPLRRRSRVSVPMRQRLAPVPSRSPIRFTVRRSRHCNFLRAPACRSSSSHARTSRTCFSHEGSIASASWRCARPLARGAGTS
jgi:hypothetical protein